MKPREREVTGEQDLFRSRLDQIIDMNHALVKLARAIDWGFLEQRFGAVYEDGAWASALADTADGRLGDPQALSRSLR
jgi:IS5 family transposase